MINSFFSTLLLLMRHVSINRCGCLLIVTFLSDTSSPRWLNLLDRSDQLLVHLQRAGVQSVQQLRLRVLKRNLRPQGTFLKVTATWNTASIWPLFWGRNITHLPLSLSLSSSRHSTLPTSQLSVRMPSACLPSTAGRPSTTDTSSCSSSTTSFSSSGAPTLWRPWARSRWRGPSPRTTGPSRSPMTFPPTPSSPLWVGPFG